MTPEPDLPISVIVPAFNAEHFIGRAIASVRAQTRLPAEIVVVNDGSTDTTARVAENAGARVIEQPNRGVGEARNAGIRVASQPWIAFLDADDEWHPNKLAVQWPATEARNGARLICTDFDYFSAGGGPTIRNHMRAQPAYAGVRRTALGADVAYIERGDAGRALVHGNFVGFSTLLVATALLVDGALFTPRSELRSDELCEEAEDLEWLLRVLRDTDLLAIERSLGNYYAQPASLSANAGRMRYGDIKLGERIAADPTRYVEGIGAEIARVRPRKEREATLAFLRSGEPARARVVAAEARSVDPSLASAALAIGVALVDNGVGRAALEATRSVWKRRKVLRAKGKRAL